MFEKNIKVAQEMTHATGLFVPKISHQDTVVAAIPKRIYANGMTSLSLLYFFSLYIVTYFIYVSSCVPHKFDLSEFGQRDLHIR